MDSKTETVKRSLKSDNENIVRFDVELEPHHSQRLNDLCKVTHRSRKNFAEALMMIVLSSQSSTIDLSTLGIVNSQSPAER